MYEHLNKFFTSIEKTDERVIAGIDEAGRGPVVGPMVYAIFVLPVNTLTQYRDSKLLTPAAREAHFSKMKNYAYIAIDPVYITSHMKGRTKNLNCIAKETVVNLLKELKDKCSNVEKVIIDGLGNNEAYKSYLESYFDFNFLIENNADANYQIVSGASIVAKVTRDEFVKPYNCGSGYPSDPNTKKWLLKNKNEFLGFPSFVRHSWKTVSKLLGEPEKKPLEKKLSRFYISPP